MPLKRNVLSEDVQKIEILTLTSKSSAQRHWTLKVCFEREVEDPQAKTMIDKENKTKESKQATQRILGWIGAIARNRSSHYNILQVQGMPQNGWHRKEIKYHPFHVSSHYPLLTADVPAAGRETEFPIRTGWGVGKCRTRFPGEGGKNSGG